MILSRNVNLLDIWINNDHISQLTHWTLIDNIKTHSSALGNSSVIYRHTPVRLDTHRASADTLRYARTLIDHLQTQAGALGHSSVT